MIVDKFETPILFIVFNRLETTQKVFEQIKKIQPTRFYVAADGARMHKPEEEEICQKIRNWILSNITWECEVKTLFRDKNLGCRIAVIEAIVWFFENEEEGIILEDDCLPSDSFFGFCQCMLKKYRYDEKIISINGCNFGFIHPENKYFHTPFMNMWGWATWKRSAILVDYEMKSWKEKGFWGQYLCLLKRIPYNGTLVDLMWLEFWFRHFNVVANDGLDTWDLQWLWHSIIQEKMSIVPPLNLVKNIGFGEGATHTQETTSLVADLRCYEIHFPIVEVNKIDILNDFEEIYVKKYWLSYNRMSFIRQVPVFLLSIAKAIIKKFII